MPGDEPEPVARPDFRAYVEQAWHVVEPATRFIGGYHVDAIAEHLQAITDGTLQNLVINIPPRHSKSSLVSVLWPTWEWIDDPYLRWLFISYGQGLSTRDSVKRRRLIDSGWYQGQWADRYQLTADQNQKIRFENDRTGVMIATSVGGLGTGEGGRRIVVDDPHNAREAESDVKREDVLEWWDATMSTRADNPTGVARVIVMQRLHERDLVGHIMNRAGEGGEQYDWLVLPAEYEPRVQVCLAGLQHDSRTEPGQLLSPDRFDQAAIEKLKVSLQERAAGQLQQRPAPTGGAVFKREWWAGGKGRWDPARIDADAGQVVERYLSYDTAMKDKESNDPTALVVLELLTDWRVRVREVRADRLQFPELLDTMRRDAQRWNYDGKLRALLIEDKASGTSAGQTLMAGADAALAARIMMFEPIGSKVYRARQATQWCALGLVLLPEPHELVPWLADFAGPEPGGKLFSFPAVQHDDEIDAFTQGVLFLENYLAEAYRRLGSTAA